MNESQLSRARTVDEHDGLQGWKLVLSFVAALVAITIASGDASRLSTHGYSPSLQANGQAAASGPKLTWSPPRLREPVTIQVDATHTRLRLFPNRDYIVRLPRAPLVVGGGLVIVGGRNVVVVGGEIDIPWQGARATMITRRALYLKAQTGFVHIEGLLLAGPDISEGIDLDEPYARAVQIENVRVMRIHNRADEPFAGGQHPDLIQMWNGNAHLDLRVDRFTGSSDYQGITLEPHAYGTPIHSATLRAVDVQQYAVTTTPWTRYLLWRDTTFPVHLTDVWAQTQPGRPCPQAIAWPNAGAWPGLRCGRPPKGDFVPATNVGFLYISPGYMR